MHVVGCLSCSGVLQFVFFQTFCGLAGSILEYNDAFQDGEWRNKRYAKFTLTGYAFVMPVRIISTIIAMYCLMLFQKGTKHLQMMNHPLQKFLSIKLIVFFTFWQRTALVRGFAPQSCSHHKTSPVCIKFC